MKEHDYHTHSDCEVIAHLVSSCQPHAWMFNSSSWITIWRSRDLLVTNLSWHSTTSLRLVPDSALLWVITSILICMWPEFAVELKELGGWWWWWLAGLLQYEDVGEEVVGMLDGMFSFVLVDLRDKSFIAARDPIGITPLYLGWGNDGTSSIKFPSCNFISTCSSRTYYCKIEVGEL